MSLRGDSYLQYLALRTRGAMDTYYDFEEGDVGKQVQRCIMHLK